MFVINDVHFNIFVWGFIKITNLVQSTKFQENFFQGNELEYKH